MADNKPWIRFEPERRNIIRMFHAAQEASADSASLSPDALIGIAKYLGLPVAEVNCKFTSSARYDDVITIEAGVDNGVRGGIKFNYRVTRSSDGTELARGFTRHAFMDRDGRVVRPPRFVVDLLKENGLITA